MWNQLPSIKYFSNKLKKFLQTVNKGTLDSIF